MATTSWAAAPSAAVPTSPPPRQAPLVWLDALKGIAILAVIFDHAFVVDDYLVWKHAYFAVSWFIFLAGVSNTLSAQQRGFVPERDTAAYWVRRCRALLGPYLWVSVIAYLLLHAQHLSSAGLARRLVFADSQPQLYFVALLLQLLFAFPLLYLVIYRSGSWTRLVAVIAVLLTVRALARWVSFPWALGAHYLLGGSFLYLFLLGMLAAPVLRSPGRRFWPLLAVSAVFLLLGESELLRTGGRMMTHPPSTPMLVYTLGLLGVAYAICQLWPWTPPIRLLSRLGRRSLDIFLYHYLFLLPFLPFRDTATARTLPFPHGQAVIVAIAIPTAVTGSLVAAWLSGLLQRWLAGNLRQL